MTTARVYLYWSVILLAGLVPALLLGSRGRVSATVGSASSDFNPKSVRVYVSLFDINAAPGKEPAAIRQVPAPQKSQPGGRPSGESPHVLQDADTSSKQAERLKAFFGDALLQALRKSGFNAAPVGSSHPGKGVLLKGVFAEVDSQNHNCLADSGGYDPVAKIRALCGGLQSGAARSAALPRHDHGELRCAVMGRSSA